MANVAVIKTMLRSFEMVSGLKINFAKSCFNAFGMSDEWVNNVADFLNYRLLSMPFTYLGIPIGANLRQSETWGTIIAKCEKRLSKWRQRHISFGGRMTLIKYVLTSIPIFYFSFLRVPKKVVGRLEKLQWWFLWGGEDDQNKISWVNWEDIYTSREKGGLGI